MPGTVLEHFTFTHPRRSSDFCLRAAGPAAGDVTPVVYGVADMIGHPTGLRWSSYMGVFERQLKRVLRAGAPADPEALHRIVLDFLAEQSVRLNRFRSVHDRSAFGFCVCMAECFGRRVRVVWLGDCRAYRLRRRGRGRDVPAVFEAECLTEDHNDIARLVREGEGTILFKHELVERSKCLNRFLGIDDDDAVRDTLARSHLDLELGPGECLVLLTDGVYMPHVRQLVENASERLTMDRYRLETWLCAMLADVDQHIPSVEPDYWEELVSIFLEQTLAHTRRHRRFRDDMALVGIYPALRR